MTIERRARTLHGNCLEVLATLEADSIDAVVTDPPYGLEFMGKDWDSFKTGRAERYAAGGRLLTPAQIAERRGNGGAGPSYVNRPAKRCRTCGRQAWSGTPCTCDRPDWEIDHSPLRAFQAWSEDWATAVRRVLKPGGHLLAFGGTRTYHRLTVAIEDAGFEVRDCLMWLYGSGFPKSLDVSKAIDKAAGAERTIVGIKRNYANEAGTLHPGKLAYVGNAGNSGGNFKPSPSMAFKTAPATDAARKWQGWGTALKPAYEPIVLARKPLVGTVAANVQQYGTGAINVDGCRVQTGDRPLRGLHDSRPEATSTSYDLGSGYAIGTTTLGRWPANVIHDGSAEVVGLFPQSKDGVAVRRNVRGLPTSGFIGRQPDSDDCGYGGGGSAARFFYTAKASRRERGEGNTHPTVKPLALMRYLCKLITPPDGLILDPFAGSGSTGVAAVREGFRFLGIDQDDASVRTAERRAIAMEFLPLERFLVEK